eukprot:SAG31_NODE_700_length_12734_cov_212.705105_1_plen_105_part_00
MVWSVQASKYLYPLASFVGSRPGKPTPLAVPSALLSGVAALPSRRRPTPLAVPSALLSGVAALPSRRRAPPPVLSDPTRQTCTDPGMGRQLHLRRMVRMAAQGH